MMDDLLRTETRPCGDCFWFRTVKDYQGGDIHLCKKKLMGVTKTMLVTYHAGWGTCWEDKTVKVKE